MSNRREKNRPLNAINKQLEATEAKEKEKDDNWIQLGKFFYSLSGMTYAGAILTKLDSFKSSDAMAIYWGALAGIIFATIAWYLIKIGNIKK